MTKIAIIGAGLAGITLANKLKEVADVTVFEKSRGFGGRMATRRADPFAFDHGAQYFTIKSDAFKAVLQPYFDGGSIQSWLANMATLKNGHIVNQTRREGIYVAMPGMSGLVRAMADGLQVKRGIEISRVDGKTGNWTLSDKEDQNHGPFDWIISSAPAPQTQRLLPESFSEAPKLEMVKMLPGFTLMLGFTDRLKLPFDGAFIEEAPIGFIAVNSTKPGRGNGTTLVVQSRNDWAETHVDEDRDVIAATLFKALKTVTGLDIPDPDHQAIHRWLYTNVGSPVGEPFLLDPENRIAACGDWCIKGRVEAAFESGNQLGDAFLAHIAQ